MNNKKIESTVFELVEELDNFEITTLSSVKKLHDRITYYEKRHNIVLHKLFDLIGKECDCGIHKSSSVDYRFLHNILMLLKNNDEKISIGELASICSCKKQVIYNFLRSAYNCGDFKQYIVSKSPAEYQKEEKTNNLNKVLKIAKEYSEKNGGITLKKLEKLTGLSYATIHNYVNENEELEGYIKYLRK